MVTGYTGDYAAQKIFGPTSEQVVRFDNVGLLTKEVETAAWTQAFWTTPLSPTTLKTTAAKASKWSPCPTSPPNTTAWRFAKTMPKTLALLNDSLAKVRASGKYAEIEAKYFATGK